MTAYLVDCPECQCRFPVDSQTMRVVPRDRSVWSFPNPAFERPGIGVVVSDEDYHAAMGLDPEPATYQMSVPVNQNPVQVWTATTGLTTCGTHCDCGGAS